MQFICLMFPICFATSSVDDSKIQQSHTICLHFLNKHHALTYFFLLSFILSHRCLLIYLRPCSGSTIRLAMARFVCNRSKELFRTTDAARGTVAVCLDANRHRLRVRATDLRTVAIIVTLAVTLTWLIPVTSAAGVRRYGRLRQFDGSAVTRERSLDQITDLLDRLMTKRKLGQVSFHMTFYCKSEAS